MKRRWLTVLSLLLIVAMVAMGAAALAEEELVVEAAEDAELSLAAEPTDGDEPIELTFDEDEAEEIPEEVLVIEPDAEEIQEVAPVEQTFASPVANVSSDFEIDEDGVLVKYNGFDKNIVIPNGVKKIGDGVFKDDQIMVSVSIPNSVTYIGYSAFYGCSNLKSITIPNSVTETDSYVLAWCDSLTSVQLSSNMTEIANDFFSGCSSLEKVVLPNGITRIGSWAFYGCNKLSSITIPSGVTEIGYSAFGGCNSLKSIVVPSGIIQIEDGTFSSCYSLESVTIPNSVTVIDRGAFSGSENVVIRGSAGSYAERFANGMSIPFNAPVVSFDEKTYWCIDDADDHYGVVVYLNQTRALKTAQKPSDLATSLKWSSSNTKVATVDQSGNVKGIAKGYATIIAATANGKGKAAKINVYVPDPTEVSFAYDDEYTAALGQTIEIAAHTSTPYSYDTGVDFPISWSTSDKSIVSIDSTKVDSSSYYKYRATLKGNKVGKATITATTPDGGKATVTVEVYRPDPDEVVIKPADDITLHPGETYSLSASVLPAEADQTITWSSDDTDVATVSDTGVITAVGKGWAWITAESVNGRTSGIEVEVVPPTPTAVTLNKTKASVGLYDTLVLKATLSPAHAESEFTVTSSKPSVADAYVDYDGNVEIYAYKKGTTTITVTTGNGLKATATVTVKAQPKKVTLNKSGTVTLKLGKTLKLKATITKNTATTLTWKSSKPSVAKVSQSGVVTPVKKGTTTITVKTSNGKKATVKVKVEAPKPTKVKLTAAKTTLAVKEKVTLKPTFTPAYATSTLTWSTSNKKVATVSKKGVVTAKKKGTAKITVKTANGKKATIKITVK